MPSTFGRVADNTGPGLEMSGAFELTGNTMSRLGTLHHRLASYS